MPRRPISPTLHGVLDYVTGATLAAAPAVLGLGGTAAGRVLRATGASTAGYSLLTRYPLGVRGLLPYRAHLALDAAGAAGLVASPWLTGSARKGTRHWLPHVLFGVFELGTVALSDPRGDAAAAEPAAAAPEPMAAEAAPAPIRSGSSQEAVMPDGAEANAKIGARTVGGGDLAGGGGIGSGTGPGSDAGVGGQQL